MRKFYSRFQRPKATRAYKKVFNVFMEGEKTEPLYFEMIKEYCSKIHIEIHHSNKKTSAKQILQKAKKFISDKKPKKFDEIWVVADADNNKKEDLQNLINWSNQKDCHGFALSTPKFEYWLLLHFDKGDKIKSLKILDARLEKHLPNYCKSYLDTKKLKKEIHTAIKNARNKHSQCKDWFCDNHTTVFLLIEKILAEEDSH